MVFSSSRLAVPGVLALGTISLIALAGCAATPAAAPEPSADLAVTVDNCGTEVVFDSPPQRIVTVKSSTTELLLALGVGDRIVAQAFPDGPIPEQWAPEGGITVLSDSAPGQESVLELEPDLVRFLSMLYAAADDFGKPFPVELSDVRRDADLTAITAHLVGLSKDKEFEAFLDAPADGEPEGELDVDINIEAPDGEEVEEEADFDFGARMRPRG